MIDNSNLPRLSDDIVHEAKKFVPDAELYELGALLISIGCFLTASAIPDLWPRLRGTAELAHELLLNTQTKEKLNVKAE
jgi:hypothetical protein